MEAYFFSSGTRRTCVASSLNPHTKAKNNTPQREKGELICHYLLFCKFLAVAAPEVLVFGDLSLGG